MTAYKALGTYGNAAGVVTPLDHKLSLAAGLVKTTTPLVIRPGLFYAGSSTIVSGTAGMAYSVAAYELATQRSASAGVVYGGNDGALSVATTAAPGSNSRYDVVYQWHREYSLDGTDSNPVIGVVQGTAAASPTVPSLAAYPGAIELARILVPAGVTATNSGTTITQTAPFTTVDGGKVPFRTTTEMNVWTTALTAQLATDLSTGIIYRWNGSAWKGWESDLIAYTATVGANITLGTGGTKNAWYQWVNGTPRMKAEIVLGTGGSVGASPGNNTITLPPVTIAPLRHAYQTFKGNVMFHDASVQTNFSGGLFSENTSTTVARIVYRSGPETNISATVPFGAAFTVGDCIEIDVWLEVA